MLDKHYSTWNDRVTLLQIRTGSDIVIYLCFRFQYAHVDRFFLWMSPFLFLLFNVIYWVHFYIWDAIFRRDFDAIKKD